MLIYRYFLNKGICIICRATGLLPANTPLRRPAAKRYKATQLARLSSDISSKMFIIVAVTQSYDKDK